MHKQFLSKIAHIKNQLNRRREFIPVNKVDSEVTTHSQKQVQRVRVWTAKRDGGGIRHPLHGMFLNPGGHRLVGTNIFSKKKKVLHRREVDTAQFTRDFFSHTFMCRICMCGSCVRVRHYKVISIHVSSRCVSNPEIHFTFTLVQHFFLTSSAPLGDNPATIHDQEEPYAAWPNPNLSHNLGVFCVGGGLASCFFLEVLTATSPAFRPN